MEQTLIKWRLGEVMARYRIKGVDLAKTLDISNNSVSNLKRAKTMPRLDGNQLNLLCKRLNALAQDKTERITPAMLIDYVDDIEGEEEAIFAHNKRNRGGKK